ncbi:MAG: EAL domain-containing protein [Sphingomonadaceae bacterium]
MWTAPDPGFETGIPPVEPGGLGPAIDWAQVEQSIDALAAEVHALYDAAPFGSHILDAQGTYLEINARELSWLGYRREEIVGKKKLSDFLSAASQIVLQKYLAAWSQRSVLVDLELELVRRDGSRMPVGLNSAGFADGSGQSAARRGVMFDLRDHQQQKIDVLVANAAFDSVSGMCITDSEHVIQHVNQAFTDLTGYSAQEVIGQTPRLLSSGHHDATFYQHLWQTVHEQGRWQGEIWNKRKDGSFIIEWLSITAVFDAAGKVSNYIGSFLDITGVKTSEAELFRLAYYDPLTQLPNRRLLLDRLTQALAGARRNGQSGAVLFVDLDHFKTINDTCGHAAGDVVLVETARRLRTAVRAADSVARLGGDEFVVLLENLHPEAGAALAEAERVADKILLALGRAYLLGAQEFHCGASIGIELFVEGTCAADLIQHADLAMYHAKAGGRRQVRVFDAAMQVQLIGRTALENDLRHALERQQFELYFQPQVDLQGQIVAAEALLRWRHPERGLVAPAEFIALAEDTALIVSIGLWVLQAACAQLKAREAMPQARHLQLAVNVSARQYRQDDFLSTMRQVLRCSAIDPGKLVLEVTESMMLDVPDAIGKMTALKALGVRFSMDDFGTGYSSLASLTLLPLSELKIDQSFVRKLGTNPHDAIIVRATIALGQSLGLEVIAEGVETQQQRDMLAHKGCQRYQGYFFSKPVPVAEFDALLQPLASC